MATPATGAISFADLSVEIMQASSTSQRSMTSASQRLGYGATDQVSMSDLRKAYGATVTIGSYSSKFFTLYGYDTVDYGGGATGSIDDNVITGTQTLQACAEYTTSSGNTLFQFNSIETGFEGTNVNRAAIADTTRTLGTSNTDYRFVTYSMPASGTVTIGLRWTV